MESKKPCEKPPFPTMSAHFAHTLEDMEEKYVKIQFIELENPEGYLTQESLDLLKLSRENKIVFDNNIYDLKTIDGNYYYYLNTNSTKQDDENILGFKQISLNIDNGYYITKVVKTEDGKAIQEVKQDISTLQGNLNDLTEDVNTVKSDLSSINDKITPKVEIETMIDEKINVAIADIADEVDASFSDLTYEFNRNEGKLTLNFVRNDESIKSVEIDLPTEELVKNVTFDSLNSQLVIEWENGQTTYISIKTDFKPIIDLINDKTESIENDINDTSNPNINSITKQYASGYSREEISNNFTWGNRTVATSGKIKKGCYGNEYYLIATENGNLAYSLNGENWQSVEPFTSGIVSIAYGNGLFVAIDSHNSLWTCSLAPNGLWTNVHTFTTRLNEIRFINDKFYVVGQNGYIAHSIDGVKWFELSTGINEELVDIAYGDGKYAAVGKNGAMICSLNGKEWYNITDSEFTSNYNNVIYGNGIFAATSDNGIRYYNGLALHSTLAGQDIRSITYSNKRFYAINYTTNEILYSKDCVNWETSFNASNKLSYVFNNDGLFITGDENGNIYKLDLGIEWFNNEIESENKYYRFALTKNNGNVVYSEIYYQEPGTSEEDVLNIIQNNSEQTDSIDLEEVRELSIGTSVGFNGEDDEQIPTSKAVSQEIDNKASGYYNKTEVDNKFSNYYNKAEVEAMIDQKINVSINDILSEEY